MYAKADKNFIAPGNAVWDKYKEYLHRKIANLRPSLRMELNNIRITFKGLLLFGKLEVNYADVLNDVIDNNYVNDAEEEAFYPDKINIEDIININNGN